MKRVVWGVLSTARIGIDHVLPAMLASPVIELRAIASRSAAAAEHAARTLGIARAYGSYEELIADPDIEAIYNPLPNHLHVPLTLQAAAAGKHVLCEKPLAMTVRQSGELAALARSRPRQAAAVNYNMRFYPLAIEARERVRGGQLGAVHHISGSYVQDWLLLETDYNWRVLAAEGGELRAVADIGTHWLDLVHAVTGLEVEALCADLLTVHPRRLRPRGEVETFSGKLGSERDTEPVAITTEDYGAILLRFKGGARGTLMVSQVTAGRKNCLRYELAGERGALYWDSERPDELWLGRRSGPNEQLLRDPSLLSGPARQAAGVPGGHAEGYADTFKQHFRAFYGYVAKGDFEAPRPFPTFADGHREVALCEAVLESHRKGAWVSIGER